MIITEQEIKDFEISLEEDFNERRREEKDQYAAYDAEYPGLMYLYNNPHLLLAVGFDEYRQLEWSNKNERLIERSFPRLAESMFPLGFESLYRSERSGEWHIFQGLMPKDNYLDLLLNFVGSQSEMNISTNDLLKKLRAVSENPTVNPNSLVLAGLWAPEKQALSRIELIESTREIIMQIHQHEKPLNSVNWRTLEEIVAELLRCKGLQIHLTPRSADGGRDVIARGELIPGEPMTIAIEVKHKPVVSVHDVRSALYANRSFPGLLIATSGRFSAGVIREKQENAFRLFLKDGVALRQWISIYCGGNLLATQSRRRV
jgi:restriction system protein